MAAAKKDAKQDWPEADESLSPLSTFSTVKPNPDPNPNNEEPPPGPSVIEVLGKAKED